MTYAFTGHRPGKLGGYTPLAADRLSRFAAHTLFYFHPQPTHVITGIALGWDQAIADAAFSLAIPFTAAIPCLGQESAWPEPSRKHYHHLLRKASVVHRCSDDTYRAELMQERNEWMVDQLTGADDRLVALWDGSASGTGNCVAYARRTGKQVVDVWAAWMAWEVTVSGAHKQ